MKNRTIRIFYGTEIDKRIEEMISSGWAIYNVFEIKSDYYITFIK